MWSVAGACVCGRAIASVAILAQAVFCSLDSTVRCAVCWVYGTVLYQMFKRGRTFVDVKEVVDESALLPRADMIPIYKTTPVSQKHGSDQNERYHAEFERQFQQFTSTAPSQHVKVPNFLGGFNCRIFAQRFMLYKAHYERTAHKFKKCDHQSLDAMTSVDTNHAVAVLRGEPRICCRAEVFVC